MVLYGYRLWYPDGAVVATLRLAAVTMLNRLGLLNFYHCFSLCSFAFPNTIRLLTSLYGEDVPTNPHELIFF
jgi:hypothetical protein